jgi:hypothetical protein
VVECPTFFAARLGGFNISKESLKWLEELNRDSNFNKRAMHSIGIDLILWRLLGGDDQFTYCEVVFTLDGSCRRIAREIFVGIVMTRSDYAVVLQLSRWLKRDVQMASQTLLDVFTQLTSKKRVAYPLGTLRPFYVHCFPQIPHEFRIEFDLQLDLQVISASRVSIFLFAIEDKFQSRMALFIHNECLFVC